MATFPTVNTIRIERRRGNTVQLRGQLTLEAVLEALDAPGETLKMSRKTWTRRVGDWVIKESRHEAGLGPIKHTLLRQRYHQGWIAANHLAQRGVRVPEPLAFVEKGKWGIIAGNALICEYLDGYHNVEKHAAELVATGSGEEVIGRFFSRLADAINGLCAAGACHSDLSGKNIFTKDGETFYFIDLDGVVLKHPYTDDLRRKNHVELYDSFCDAFDGRVLAAFIAQLLPPDHDARLWLPHVIEGQRRRRARQLAIWKRQGHDDS